MAHTRRLQGVVHQANGNPWAGFAFRITLTPSRPMPHATLPSQTITIGTDATGQYSVDLEVNATYLIEEVGSYAQSGSSTRYPRGSQYTITMPDGDTPVSLEELRSGDIVIPGGSALPDIVQEIADDLVAHEQDMDNPHSVTAAQVGLGNVADLGPANLPISTATQNALDLKADDADLTAHEQNFGNPHNVTAAQLPDLDSEVSASPDVAANTAARHGHSNKSLLDSYDQTNADISATITDRHTHSNKVTLDQTQEPYTTADKQALDALALAESGYGDVVTHDVAEFATAAQGAKADTAVQIETDPTVPSWAKQPAKPSYTKAEIGLGNVTNDAQVTLTTSQIVTGIKTFQPVGYAPSFGSNLAPALSAMTLGGTATYNAPNIDISGAATISFDISVTSGELYQIEWGRITSAGYSNIDIALGSEVATLPYSHVSIGLVAATTGVVTVSWTCTNWTGGITAFSVRQATRASLVAVMGGAEVRIHGTNIGVGYRALYSNTTGGNNVGMGYQALYSNTTGGNNVGMGSNALYSNTTGNSNVGMGSSTLRSNTTGGGNIGMGYQALYSNTTGDNNIGMGSNALYSNTTGNSNVGMGSNALYAPAGNSGNATTTASYQTAVGVESGQSSATQVDGITVMGRRALAGATNASAFGREARADHEGSVALGYQSQTTATNQVMVGPRDIEITDTTRGVILKSPDGTRYRIKVANGGALSAVAV